MHCCLVALSFALHCITALHCTELECSAPYSNSFCPIVHSVFVRVFAAWWSFCVCCTLIIIHTNVVQVTPHLAQCITVGIQHILPGLECFVVLARIAEFGNIGAPIPYFLYLFFFKNLVWKFSYYPHTWRVLLSPICRFSSFIFVLFLFTPLCYHY